MSIALSLLINTDVDELKITIWSDKVAGEVLRRRNPKFVNTYVAIPCVLCYDDDDRKLLRDNNKRFFFCYP